MQDKLNQIKELALVEIKEAKDSTTIDTIRVKYLGKGRTYNYIKRNGISI